MQRIMTAAAVVALSLGMAGLAQAQNYPSSSQPNQQMHPNAAVNTPATTPGNPNAPLPQNHPNAATGSSASNVNNQMQGNQPAAAPNGQIGNQAQNLSPQEIEQAQRALQQKGLYHCRIDGIVGPETQSALSQFQQSEGLPQTATLDQDTLNRLMGAQNPNAGGNVGSTMAPSQPQPNGRSGQ